MALYGHAFASDRRVRWQFLTTASVAKLMPLLDGLGQDVTVETDARGRPTRALNHLLKVFLIDARLSVREIYSVATLDPRCSELHRRSLGERVTLLVSQCVRRVDRAAPTG